MPQMSPLNWIFLFFFFILTFGLFMIQYFYMNYFQSKSIPFQKSKKSHLNKFMW